MDKELHDFILSEEVAFRTVKIPVTNSKEWNMADHIDRCNNVSHGWFHTGKNDDTRPHSDIVTPILNVARRSEGFDVKDIIPYVNDSEKHYKSFLVKKYHPQWARKHEIDTFIDELVDSSIIYDLALVKNVNNVRPMVVPLQTLAFCDQTSILSGPICIKHQFSMSEFEEFRGKWDADKMNQAIAMSQESKKVSSAGDRVAKTPGKYMEVYELHGTFKETWHKPEGNPNLWTPQIHIVMYYQAEDGTKNGITLFKGAEKKKVFKALVVNPVFGRACGYSIVESLFQDQVWHNYSGIRIKEMLDAAAVVLFQSSDPDTAGKKLKDLKMNTVLKHSEGHPISRVDSTIPNIAAFTNERTARENNARIIGSANEAQLGVSPASGTPFALQNAVIGEGQGIHEFRQGKIATFVSDQLYRDWILNYLVADMNGGKNFSEDLSYDELAEIAEAISENVINKKAKEHILSGGKVPTVEDKELLKTQYKSDFMKKGTRRFFEALEGELEKIPIDVFINIAGKQKRLAQNADKLTNIIREVIANPQAFRELPGLAKPFNELIESSGFSPMDFSKIVEPEEPKDETLSTVSPLRKQQTKV